MEFNKTITYYEIIDSNPIILKDKIPLIEFFKKLSYYILSPLIIFKYILKGDLKISQLFKKEEITNGRENNKLASYKKLNNLEEKEIFKKDEKVLRTVSLYLSKKESKKVLKELLSSGFKIDLNDFSSSFSIKKRIEYILSEDNNSKTIIMVTYPVVATKINNFFKKFNL